MRLIALELEHFRQYAQASLTLDTGITAIVGANGAGKSTLVEAILWALYGAGAIRGTVDTLRFLWSEGGAKPRVMLEFELGGRRYQVQRTPNDAHIALFSSSGWQRLATGTSAVNRFVPQLLGMNLQQFQTSFCARQKELEFMHYAPEKRREEISKMLGYDRVRVAIETVSEHTRALQSEVEGLKQGIGDPEQIQADIETLKSELQQIDTNLQQTKIHLDSARQTREQARQRYETESAKRTAYQSLQTSLQLQQNQQEHLQRLMDDYRAQWDALKRAEARYKELKPALECYRQLQKRLAELDKLAQTERQRAQLLTSLQHLNAQIEDLQTRLAELQQKQTERKALEPIVQEYEQLEQSLRTLRQHAQMAQKRARLIAQQETLKEQLQSLQRLARDYQERTAEYQQALQHLKTLKAEYTTQQQTVQRLTDAWHAERTSAEADLRTHSAQMSQMEARVEQLRSLGAETKCPTCGQPLGEAYQHVLESALQELQQARKTLQSLKKRADQLAQEPSELVQARKQLETLQQELNFKQQEQARLESELQNLQKQLDGKANIEKTIADLQRQINAIPPYDPEQEHALSARLDALRPAYQRAHQLEGELRQLPTLQRELQTKLQEQERTQAKLNQLPTDYNPDEHAQVRHEIEQLHPLYEEFLALQATLKGKEELKRKIETAKAELKLNAQQQEELRRQLDALNYSEEEFLSAESAFHQAEAEVRALEAQYADLRTQREGVVGRLSALQSQLEQIRQRQQHLQEKQRELLLHQTLRKALQEFRTELNTRLRPLLADYATEFLASLTGGRYTQLEIDDEFRFQIIDEGMRKAVISGGEQDVVNLSLRLALARLITERAGQPLSLLILDEVFGSLDTDRRRNVLDVLNNLRDWFEQILVISHIEEINESADRCLYVVRDERTRRSQVLERLPTENTFSNTLF